MRRSTVLVLLGATLWGISWFVTPHGAIDLQRSGFGALARAFHDFGKFVDSSSLEVSSGRSVGGSADVFLSTKGPPGWRAFRIALEGLTTETKDDDRFRVRTLGATALTNAVMAIALVVAVLGGLRGPRALGFGAALLVCAALDLSWVYLTDDDFRGGLEIGYGLWVAGFVLVGLGALGRGGSSRLTA